MWGARGGSQQLGELGFGQGRGGGGGVGGRGGWVGDKRGRDDEGSSFRGGGFAHGESGAKAGNGRWGAVGIDAVSPPQSDGPWAGDGDGSGLDERVWARHVSGAFVAGGEERGVFSGGSAAGSICERSTRSLCGRCRRLVEEFLGFVEKQKEKGCFGVVSILVARFAAELLLRRDIRRSSTIRSYLTEVTRCWPSALKAPEVQEFMRGLETLSPALPEAAGVTLARSCGRFAAGVWMRREIGLNNGYSVAIVAGLMAGLRVREAARMLMRKDGFRCSEEGLVAWREDCATKTNMRGWRYLPERVAEVPLEVAPTLSRLALPWSADDKEVRRVIAATIGALVKAGFPRGCAGVQADDGGAGEGPATDRGRHRGAGPGMGEAGVGSSSRIYDDFQISGGGVVAARTAEAGEGADEEQCMSAQECTRLERWAVRRMLKVKAAVGFGLYDAVDAGDFLPYGGGELDVRIANWARSRGVGDRQLPEPAVECVDLEIVARWASPAAYEVLEVMFSRTAFESRVIAEGERDRGLEVVHSRRVLVEEARLKEMRRLRYVRPLRRRPAWGTTCNIFFVPKDDRFDRMIYNGVPLNKRCRRPPSVDFVAMRECYER